MLEDLIIRHCSPTLAGIKTGNLFSCACLCRKEPTKVLPAGESERLRHTSDSAPSFRGEVSS